MAPRAHLGGPWEKQEGREGSATRFPSIWGEFRDPILPVFQALRLELSISYRNDWVLQLCDKLYTTSPCIPNNKQLSVKYFAYVVGGQVGVRVPRYIARRNDLDPTHPPSHPPPIPPSNGLRSNYCNNSQLKCKSYFFVYFTMGFWR